MINPLRRQIDFKLSVLVILAAVGIQVHAQNITFHCDKPYYFGGEFIFFNLFIPFIHTDSTCVVNVHLGTGSQVVQRHYLLVSKSKATGHFKLPYDLPSDIYFIGADLIESKTNQAEQIFVRPISIYNTFKGNSGIEFPKVEFEGIQSKIESGAITIHLPNRILTTRDSVQCTIKVDQSSLNNSSITLSIAIRNKSLYQQTGRTIISDLAIVPSKSWIDRIPISGRRKLVSTHAINNPLMGIAFSQGLRFEVASVRQEVFQAAIPLFYGSQYVEFIDYITDDFSIEVNTGPRPIHPTVAFNQDHKISDQLTLYEKRKMIYQLYRTVDIQNEIIVNPSERPQISPNYEIDVKDFALRGTLLNLFKEVLAPLKFYRRKDGKHHANILYDLAGVKTLHERPPLFIVNGRITRNDIFISQLPIQDVSYIRIYSETDSIRRHFGVPGIYGIVEIEMIDKTYTLPEEVTLPGHVLDGLQPPFNYPIKVDRNAPHPLLKSLLYWNPSGRIDETGQFVFDFATSDDQSAFEIEVVAYRSDGTFALANQIFEVRKKWK